MRATRHAPKINLVDAGEVRLDGRAFADKPLSARAAARPLTFVVRDEILTCQVISRDMPST